MGNISKRIAGKAVDHFGIGKYRLADCDGIVGISKLNLTMCKHASDTNWAGLRSLPMPAQCGFVFLIKQWVHYYKISIYYNFIAINFESLLI